MPVRNKAVFCRLRALLPAVFLLTSGFLFGEVITFSADKMAGYSGDTSDYTRLEGRAIIKTTKIEITADLVELSGDDFRFISATGSVKGRNIDSDMDFSCDSMHYDRKTEVVILRTNADILDHQNEVTAKAQLIEFNQKTEVAIMQIDVELKQKRSVCTSAFAIYRKQEQMLEMSGNPKIQREEDQFRAREIILNLDTEDILLDGRVRGSVKSTDEPAAKTAPTAPDAPADTPETAPAPEAADE
jgi:lipopolysaccharide export system protein LptA